jgi:cell division protein FtsN
MISQRGGFVMGLVAGLLIGLALALGVALYITKAPVPFLNKVPQRTAEQDSAETERNRTWDPNAPLGGKAQARAAAAASGVVAETAAAASGPQPMAPTGAVRAGVASAEAASAARPPARDPAALLAGSVPPTAAPAAVPAKSAMPGADPFLYFVQAGAFTRSEDAEQQRARLALLGQTAKITEREQAGRTVYRVRLGPFPARDEADSLQLKLQEQTIEAQIVRVERP